MNRKKSTIHPSIHPSTIHHYQSINKSPETKPNKWWWRWITIKWKKTTFVQIPTTTTTWHLNFFFLFHLILFIYLFFSKQRKKNDADKLLNWWWSIAIVVVVEWFEKEFDWLIDIVFSDWLIWFENWCSKTNKKMMPWWLDFKVKLIWLIGRFG